MGILKQIGRRWWLFGLALIGAITLGGLGGCSPPMKSDVSQVSQLVVGFSSDPKTFNAVLSEERPNVFQFFTYEGLLSGNGLTGEVKPGLAESWEFSEDNLQLTFTLRENLKWSDGEPLTADDVLFTFNDVIFNEDIPTSARDVLRVGEDQQLPTVTKLDDLRIQFTVPEPFAPFLRTAGGMYIMPKHALEASIQETAADGNLLFLSTWGLGTDPKEIICNGPYTISAYVPGERVIFERNPYYWKKDDQGDGQPYIQRIVRPIVESSDTALAQFRSGGLDATGVSPSNYSLLKKEEERGDFKIQIGGPASGMTFIMLNLNQGSRGGQPLVDPIKSRWFNNVSFRQAIAYGIDRRTMINNIYRGIGEPQYSPISVQSPYYLSPDEGLKVYEYEPERAKQLLQDAGFTYDAAGQLLDAEGNRVRFTFSTPSGSPVIEAIGAQVKRDLDKIGMQIDYQPLAWGALLDKLDVTLDWDCALLGFTGGVEPNGAFNLWSPEGRLHMFNLGTQTEEQEPIEGRQVSGWETEIGQLYVAAAKELDEEKRKAIYAEAQQIALEKLPLIYMINPMAMAAVRNKVTGVQYSALETSMLWNVEELQVTINN